jgi:hypothetical protein
MAHSEELEMAFDDTRTESLVVLAGIALLCGLLAPFLPSSWGAWRYLLTSIPPLLLVAVLECRWRRERRSRGSQPDDVRRRSDGK